MPLRVRSIAATIAVVCFFCVAIIGWINGLSPFVCCKRAVMAALFAYVAGVVVTKMINAILINAIVADQMNRQEKDNSGGNS